MTPVKQTITGTPYANCFQAAVASYFDLPLDMVPNFMLFRDEYWEAIVRFFMALGYDIGYVHGTPPNDGKFYIGSVDASKYYSHAVIVKSGVIVHDPHPKGINKNDVIKGYYWISKRSK